MASKKKPTRAQAEHDRVRAEQHARHLIEVRQTNEELRKANEILLRQARLLDAALEGMPPIEVKAQYVLPIARELANVFKCVKVTFATEVSSDCAFEPKTRIKVVALKPVLFQLYNEPSDPNAPSGYYQPPDPAYSHRQPVRDPIAEVSSREIPSPIQIASFVRGLERGISVTESNSHPMRYPFMLHPHFRGG